MRSETIMRRWRVALVALTFALVVAPAPGAVAHTGTIETRISAEAGRTPPGIGFYYCMPPCIPLYAYGPGFEIRGVVESNYIGCRAHRNVKIYNRADGTVTWQGSVLSDEGGAFSIELRGEPEGEYFARVAKRIIEEGAHRHTCTPATSQPVTVDP